MAEGDYQPEPYRPTFPLDFNGFSYEYRKQQYQPPSQPYQSSYGREGAPAGVGILPPAVAKLASAPHYASTDSIDTVLKADRYITGQTIEGIIAMIGMRTFLKKRIQGELQHMRAGLQDRINETMYTGNKVGSMVKRRSDLGKQLLQVDTEAIREEQTFWKDIMMLSKELRYKLEQYRKEKAKEGFF
jgi:hypothetical protein